MLGPRTFRKDIAALESNLQKLDEQEQKYSAELETALYEYTEVKSHAANLDPVELYEAGRPSGPDRKQPPMKNWRRRMEISIRRCGGWTPNRHRHA